MTALRPALWLAALLAGSAGLSAQDKKEPGKQKAAAIANVKKADLGGARVVETGNFVVATTLSEERAKALGAALEKVAPVARKAAQFEEKDEPWKGKLTLYLLPDGRDFKAFVRGVLMAEPDGTHYDLRGENPLVVDPVELTGKATEADQTAHAAAVVAGAYLRAKGGAAQLPRWLTDGFGRVTAMRAEGVNSKRYLAHRAAARAAALGGKGLPPAAPGDLWAETPPANAAVVANSLAEFLAYGPGKENFTKVVSGFRPNENGTVPAAPQVFEAAGWKDIPALEVTWRRWMQTGK
jgi:hypothetical protein